MLPLCLRYSGGKRDSCQRTGYIDYRDMAQPIWVKQGIGMLLLTEHYHDYPLFTAR